MPALVVRPGWARARASVLCLAGPRGTGKTSLAHAIAEALGRKSVSVPLDGEATEHQIMGSYRRTPGCVVDGLRDAKVNNPVFILEGIDQAGDADEDPHPLLGVLDSSKRTAFVDVYLAVPLDLSGVLWVATATDAGAIPAKVRDCLHVVDLPAYTEQEKLAIAQEHLLKRPFDDPLPTSAGILVLEPAASAASAGSASSLSSPVVPVACPTVVADRVVSSVEELRALSAGSPTEGNGAGEPWRTAASRGDISFEPEAIRRVIRDYTSEPGVKDLKGCLAEICRQVALRRSPEAEGPDMVTSGLVPALLGDGSVDPLPLAVREAIEAERVRNSSDTSSSASPPSPWIEWLENLPWTKRNDAGIDLKRIRRVLDARQAGLKDAKAGVIEYLAARKRNPRGTGAVLCFLGPPGVGKTSLAQSIAQAMGRPVLRRREAPPCLLLPPRGRPRRRERRRRRHRPAGLDRAALPGHGVHLAGGHHRDRPDASPRQSSTPAAASAPSSTGATAPGRRRRSASSTCPLRRPRDGGRVPGQPGVRPARRPRARRLLRRGPRPRSTPATNRSAGTGIPGPCTSTRAIRRPVAPTSRRCSSTKPRTSRSTPSTRRRPAGWPRSRLTASSSRPTRGTTQTART